MSTRPGHSSDSVPHNPPRGGDGDNTLPPSQAEAGNVTVTGGQEMQEAGSAPFRCARPLKALQDRLADRTASAGTCANASGAMPPTPATCEACRQPFAPRRAWQRFCCQRCRRSFHNRSRSETMALRTALERIAAIAAEALGGPKRPGGPDGGGAGGRGDA